MTLDCTFPKVSTPYSIIRFWDIPGWDCKSCLVSEAASENQGLHSGIPTVLEAVEAGPAECGIDSG
jgi:hypothetical protein